VPPHPPSPKEKENLNFILIIQEYCDQNKGSANPTNNVFGGKKSPEFAIF
jgi:hypothetical protein